MTPARRVHDSAGQGSAGGLGAHQPQAVGRRSAAEAGYARRRRADRLCPSPGELIARRVSAGCWVPLGRRVRWTMPRASPIRNALVTELHAVRRRPLQADRSHACRVWTRSIGARGSALARIGTATGGNVLALLKCPHVKGHVLEREPAVAVGLHSAVGAHISSSERESKGGKKSARRKKPPANKAAGAQVRVSSAGPGSQVQRSQSACRKEPAQPR
ncbi:hypothetical protein MTO96_018936 [Rhipicephalus appendiculatus]